MSRTNHPRPARRSPSRHACDVVVHVDNALRSLAHVLDTSPSDVVRGRAHEVQQELRELRSRVIEVRTHATSIASAGPATAPTLED